MKKVIAILVLTVLVSSCGKHLSLVKRHYTKGFYVENGKGAKKTVTTENELRQSEKIKPTIASFSPVEKADQTPSLTEIASAPEEKAEKKNSFQSELKKHVPVQKKPSLVTDKAEEEKASLLSKQQKETAKSSGGDVDLIILIILCFFPFINLIAMYLKDGKNITMNFWVDLILDILFFLPGIIFALLVVLDVFSLA